MAKKGEKLSAETRKKISESCKGRKAWNKGVKMTDEQIEKMSNSLKGRKPPRTAFKVGDIPANKGKKHNQETRNKISKKIEDKWKDNDYREKRHAGLKSYWDNLDEETRIKRVETFINAPLKNTEGTSIERIVCELLDTLNIAYKTQVPFDKGHFIVDIWVPKKKTIIECNGDYWHNLKHRKSRDKELQKFCDKNKIKIAWLWESDIVENPLNALRKAISSL